MSTISLSNGKVIYKLNSKLFKNYINDLDKFLSIQIALSGFIGMNFVNKIIFCLLTSTLLQKWGWETEQYLLLGWGFFPKFFITVVLLKKLCLLVKCYWFSLLIVSLTFSRLSQNMDIYRSCLVSKDINDANVSNTHIRTGNVGKKKTCTYKRPLLCS